jgi:hypothetical protein
MHIGLSGFAYIAWMSFEIADIASLSDVMLFPFSAKIGAACGLSMRHSCAIFAQLVCLANASFIAFSLLFMFRPYQFPYFCRNSESLSTVGSSW